MPVFGWKRIGVPAVELSHHAAQWGELLALAILVLAFTAGENRGQFPAIVLTTPVSVILRIVLLPVSDTYTLPAVSTATADGRSNRASLPVPSVLPVIAGNPANVLRHPQDHARRCGNQFRWFPGGRQRGWDRSSGRV
jgi:hypothetical protein